MALLVLAVLPHRPARADEVEVRLPFLARDGERHARRSLVLPDLPVREEDGISDEEEIDLDASGSGADAPLRPSARRLLEVLPGAARHSRWRIAWDDGADDASRAATLFGALRAGFGRRVRLEVTVLRPGAPEAVSQHVAEDVTQDAEAALVAQEPYLRLERSVAEGALVETSAREEGTFPSVVEVNNGGSVAAMARHGFGPRLVASAAPAGPGRWVVRIAYHDAHVAGTVAFGDDVPSAVAPDVAFVSFAAEMPAAAGRAEMVVARTRDAATDFVLAYRVTPIDPPQVPAGARVQRLEAVSALFSDEPCAWRPGEVVHGEWSDGSEGERLRHRAPEAWITDGVTLHTVFPGLLIAEGAAEALGAFDERVAAWWRRHVAATVVAVSSRADDGGVVRRFRAPLVDGRPFRLLQGHLVPTALPRAEAGTGSVAVGSRIDSVLTGRLLELTGSRDGLRAEEHSAAGDVRTTSHGVRGQVWGEETRHAAPLSVRSARLRHWSGGTKDTGGRHTVRVAPWQGSR